MIWQSLHSKIFHVLLKLNIRFHFCRKRLRILDSEWLQLFVPKNNISVAKLTDQDFFINPTQENQSDDNTILEVWCKVFFVRELPSGF